MISCVVLLSQISSLPHPLSEPFRSPSSFLLPRPLTTIHNSLPTIFFRITSFADPHPLTSIESHLYKKHPRGVTHSFQAKSSKYPAPVSISFRIRTYKKHILNPSRMNTSKTQGLKPFRMNTYEKTGEGEGRNCQSDARLRISMVNIQRGRAPLLSRPEDLTRFIPKFSRTIGLSPSRFSKACNCPVTSLHRRMVWSNFVY